MTGSSYNCGGLAPGGGLRYWGFSGTPEERLWSTARRRRILSHTPRDGRVYFCFFGRKGRSQSGIVSNFFADILAFQTGKAILADGSAFVIAVLAFVAMGKMGRSVDAVGCAWESGLEMSEKSDDIGRLRWAKRVRSKNGLAPFPTSRNKSDGRIKTRKNSQSLIWLFYIITS